MKVSIYKSLQDSKSKETCDLIKFLTTEKYKDKVQTYRNNYNAWKDAGSIGPKPVKEGLPMVTSCGVFSYRSKDCLVEYNRTIMVDIDDVPESTLEALKNDLKQYTDVIFIAKSASGAGLMVLVNLDCGADMHLDAYFKLEEWFMENYQIKIDAACKDITRPRFATYDPDYFYRPNPSKMPVPIYTPPQPKIKKVSQIHNLSPEQKVKNWVNLVDKFKDDFSYGNGWRFLTHKVMLAIDEGIPESTVLEVFLQLSDGEKSDRWMKYHIGKLYAK